jgi:hypothetical protein
MNLPLTHLISTGDGLIAVEASDPRASGLDVIEAAPPGMSYHMVPRPPEQIDADPKARQWVAKHLPRKTPQEAPTDALWAHGGTGQQVLGNRHKPPHGVGWTLRATAPDGEVFEERQQSAGKYILVTVPMRKPA